MRPIASFDGINAMATEANSIIGVLLAAIECERRLHAVGSGPMDC
jgi:hypothetical protein